MTHDPKLVDEFLAAFDKYDQWDDRALGDLIKAREALRPAPTKPREWWLNLGWSGQRGSATAHTSEEAAKNWMSVGCEIVHVREVMPNKDKPTVWLPEWEHLKKDDRGRFCLGGGLHKLGEPEYNLLRNEIMGLDK